MDGFTRHFGVFFLVLLVGLVALAIAILRSKRRVQSATPTRSLWDYVFLWPLIFDQPARRERVSQGGRFLTTGETFGAIAFLVILIFALAIG